MKKLMNRLMLSCRKASELIDKKSLIKLSWKENLQLNMHTAMCDGCKAYEKQSHLLDNILHKHIQFKDDSQVPQIENKELQDQIISKLK
jgi:hypothetical protein